jgi:hypothetical protein
LIGACRHEKQREQESGQNELHIFRTFELNGKIRRAKKCLTYLSVTIVLFEASVLELAELLGYFATAVIGNPAFWIVE